MACTIRVPKQTAAGETRVALVPDVAGRLMSQGEGLEVFVEEGAGREACHADADYEEAGEPSPIERRFSGRTCSRRWPLPPTTRDRD